jgi:formylglycine-generating enzyme required for sulfatase activity
MVGVPCVTGSSHVANLFRLDTRSGKIRQLTFEQDHDWCPTLLNNGRVLYLRWEYSDLPHFVSRLLFHMNPDGTEQMEYYGSNSYWPNAMFYARPAPNHATRFVAVVGGHHDVPRMGELVLFDASKGTREADGALQRIPGRGKPVQPIILDGLVGGSWPKFLHPWPLSDEFHADTTKLVQLLRKGHYGVQLDRESWDRIVTWIDLNTPAHGAWGDILGAERVAAQRERRRDLMRRYAGRDEDPEAIEPPARIAATPTTPVSATRPAAPAPEPLGWPVHPQEAARRQRAGGEPRRTIELGGDVPLDLVFVPAGEFVMGDSAGEPDEQPAAAVRIERPFWMGRLEISNEQFHCFDGKHDSRFEEGDFLQFSEEERGYPVNGPRQPVARVSWHQAMQFCEWLSARTGERFTLPTEAQWEYACRAGMATPLAYGEVDTDFSRFANLADASLRKVDLFRWGLPVGAIPPWRPADVRCNDGFRVSAPVGTYPANAWQLHDMHGNVAEWTRTCLAPYPYSDRDGRNDLGAGGRRVVRGGSWDDQPRRARSAFRSSYWPYAPPSGLAQQGLVPSGVLGVRASRFGNHGALLDSASQGTEAPGPH